MVRTAGSDGARTEREIQSAAMKLIATRGYDAMTMRDLANSVGIQPGSLYRYYRSKHALLEALMISHLQTLIAEWRRVAPKTSVDPTARLRAFVDFHIGYHALRHDEVFVANMELRSLQSEARDRVVMLRQDYENELMTILAEGMDAGAFRATDIKVAAYAVLAMLTGLTVWYREDGRLTRDQLVDAYFLLIVRGLSAQAAPT